MDKPIIKIRFLLETSIFVVKDIKNYYEIPQNLFIKMFLPPKYNYQIVDKDEKADICFFSIQLVDENLLRDDEINILFVVENLSVGRTHYQHFNKFGRYGNKKVNIYFYNDIPEIIEKPKLSLPISYYFYNYYKNILQNIEYKALNTEFEQKRFCLFISQNGLNDNKMKAVNQLKNIGQIDFISQYQGIKDISCYFDNRLLAIFNQYKFIICFENSKTPGYITEKIFNVFLSKSIPIYDGAPDVDKYFNKNSYIKFNEINFIKKIKKLNQNKSEYNKMIKKQKLNTNFENNNLFNYLDNYLI